MDAGNLIHVAEALRTLMPRGEFIFGADNDVRDDGTANTGIEAATKAAVAVGGRVAVPELDGRKCDFWDVWSERGAEAVRAAITNAKPPEASSAQPAKPNAPVGDSSGPSSLDPLPLPKLPAVPELPSEILPDAFRPWIMDAADRARFDPSFMAASAMVGVGSLIGRKLGIRLKEHDDWTEYANVWGGIVGTPSTLKSPAEREGLRPVKQLQVAADKKHDAAKREWEAAAEAHKLRRAAGKKAAMAKLAENPKAAIDGIGGEAAPEKPVSRCYWTNDATVERLGEMAVENPNGLPIVRDELSSLLKTLEDEQKAEARGFYLSGWSGKEGYRFDRIMRGKTYIPAYALSIVGGIQPRPLSRFVRAAQSGEQADGLLQRLQLIVWPDAPDFEYVDRWPDKATKRQALEAFERADQFDGGAIGQNPEFGDDPPTFISNQQRKNCSSAGICSLCSRVDGQKAMEARPGRWRRISASTQGYSVGWR